MFPPLLSSPFVSACCSLVLVSYGGIVVRSDVFVFDVDGDAAVPSLFFSGNTLLCRKSPPHFWQEYGFGLHDIATQI